MSDIIRLLPDHIANQIAAGEVIQRPSSVVKELVENAIDAGATSIDVLIKDAGKTLIQVRDNGKGMSEMDARMAFERHATSKVSTAEDLFALQTKGFRGEALASIAAIAHVELQTRQEGKDLGTLVLIEGSQLKVQESVACKQGAVFSVKNLFFNVPARRNFLKSDSIEFKHIEEEFLRVALAHPELAFSLNNNGQVIYHLPAAVLRKRIVDVFGKSFNDKLVPIDEETDLARITGFVVKPEGAKKTRGDQYFFVNNRFFKDHFFHHAVNRAFEGLLAPKAFPGYFLFFAIRPDEIDVNVHPTKTEIKFEHDREIYAILMSVVKVGLGKFSIMPSMDFEQETSFEVPYEMRNQPAVEPSIQVNPNFNPFHSSEKEKTTFSDKAFSSGMRNAVFGKTSPSREEWSNFYAPVSEKEENSSVTPLFEPEKNDVPYEEVLQFLCEGSYAVCQQSNGLLLVHLKRAVEQVEYHRLMKQFMLTPLFSQSLLFPLEINLHPQEKHFWSEHEKTLKRIGFQWEFEENVLQLTGAPELLKGEAIPRTIERMQENLLSGAIEKGDVAHEVILSLAISASLQHKVWSKESLNALLEDLFALEENQFTSQGKRIVHFKPYSSIFDQF